MLRFFIIPVLLLALVFAAPTAALASGCSTPTGIAGDQIYNTTYNVMQYCNGTNWVNMGGAVSGSPPTGCGTTSGTLSSAQNTTISVLGGCTLTLKAWGA